MHTMQITTHTSTFHTERTENKYLLNFVKQTFSYFCMCTWPQQIRKGIWMSCLFMSRLACEQVPGKPSPTPTPAPRSLRCRNSSVSCSPNFFPRPLRDPDRRRFVPSSSCFPGVPENKGCCHISLSPDVMWIFYPHSGLPCYATNSVAQELEFRV